MQVLGGAKASGISPWHKNPAILELVNEWMDGFVLPEDLVTRELTAAPITHDTDIHKTPTLY